MQRKKFLINILTAILATALLTSVCFADYSKNEASAIYSGTSVNSLKADAYSLLDYDTGAVIYSKEGSKHINVGYMSQLMMLFEIYESLGTATFKEDTYIKVSKEAQAASVGKSRVFLDASKKEVIRVDEAIKAVAICNAVDAAYTLAEYAGGTVEEFVKRMNDKAAEIGMTDSYFTDVTGCDRENQYTSANDLVLLGKTFIEKYPQILEYTKLTYGEFVHESTGQPFTAMVSPNNLTRGKFYPESDGLMVGYSENSGYGMLGTVETDGKRVVACVLGEPDENRRAAEIKKLMEYGLADFEYRTVSQEGTFVRKISVKDGVSKRVEVCTAEDFNAILNVNDFSKLTHEVVIYGTVTAPVSEGTEVGEIIYKLDDAEVGRVKIVCAKDVDRAGWFTRLVRKILSWLGLD